MPAKIIDGKKIAEGIKKSIKEKVASMKQKPGLAVIIVGKNPASQIYVRLKVKDCIDVGFYSEKYELKESVKQEELINLIEKLNKKKEVHGILVQLPLPKHMNEVEVLNTVDPKKDVDGFTAFSMGSLLTGNSKLVPCTPKGVIKLIESTGEKIEGKEAVVIGRSNIVGKPVSILLLQRNATVTICHSRTKDLKSVAKRADILVAAVGRPHLVTKDMVKKGAIVIDVGINKVEGKTVGDVDFDNVKEVASYITPVPGGVGPMTRACLLENTLEAMEQQD